ncbi:MAG TPA: macro domain-containing protein [Pyrinomonadaceae bacterium]|nr:macro domain-containing protein [Pyrinomonadaceae bacterium]
MIKEVTGDILLTKAQAIAHGVAPNDHFSSGLALSLRELYPAMHQDFRHFCHSNSPKVGTSWLWGSADGKRIINLFTQEPAPNHSHAHPGKATVANVNHALRDLCPVVEKEKIKSLALPKLATGVGGLDWDDVKPLIARHLSDLGIPIFIYTTFHKGLQANEELV